MTEWLNALLSNPIVFLAGFTLGIVIGVAWNNKEVKGLKAEKAGMERDIDRWEAKFKDLKENSIRTYGFSDPEDE